MDNYVLGFSVPASVALALFAFPRIWWRLSPPCRDLLMRNHAKQRWLNWLRSGCLAAALLILLLLLDREHGNRFPMNSAFIVLIFILFFHYAAWLRYLRGRLTPFLLIVGIALLSPLYLLALEVLLHNLIAVVPTLLYGVLYVGITWNNFKPK